MSGNNTVIIIIIFVQRFKILVWQFLLKNRSSVWGDKSKISFKSHTAVCVLALLVRHRHPAIHVMLNESTVLVE